jgi:hypothetical protein
MALLGTWIDKASLQTLGGGAAGNFFQTVQHFVATIGSGPAASTTPETGIIVVRSVQSATAPGLPYWWGANASIATLGLAVGSASGASAGLVTVDCFNLYFWSAIR